MPEGHTIHRLARALTSSFAGDQVECASPQGRFDSSAQRLSGLELIDAEAWGKHLFVRFSDESVVHVHLGLYGKFAVTSGPPEPPWGQVRWRVVGPRAYADLRGPTACELLEPGVADAIMARLGPDPLRADADVGAVWTRISRSRAPIAGLLMDQSVLAGVGNVYRAEVLFRHGIDPMTRGRDLGRDRFELIWDDLALLLRAGVRSGRIVTTRREDRERRSGAARRLDAHYVYKRNGIPCRLCGDAVQVELFQGRTLYWCPSCQAP